MSILDNDDGGGAAELERLRGENVRLRVDNERLRRYETAYGYLTEAIAAAVAQWEEDESTRYAGTGSSR